VRFPSSRWLAPVLITGGLLHNIFTTWGRWGEIVNDCGRELDTPLQLMHGHLLYADVRYWYGPFAPYLNALLFRLFGPRVDTLAWAGAASAAILAALGYRILRLFVARLPAAVAATSLLYVSAFVQIYANNSFNFVMPYSYAATYGILAALGSVYFLLRFLEDESRPWSLWVSVLLLMLTAACKLEPLAAALAAHGVFIAALLAQHSRATLRVALPIYGLGVVLTLTLYGGFYARVGPALWHDNLFLSANVTAGDYALARAGLLDWRSSLHDMLPSLGGWLVCFALIAVATRVQARRIAAWARAAITAVAAVAACGIVLWLGPLRLFRSLTVLLATSAIGLLWRYAAQRDGIDLRRLIVAAFALAALLRIALRAGAEHYGFYLIVPAFLSLAMLCFDLGERFGDRAPASWVIGTALIATVAFSHAQFTRAALLDTYGDAPIQAGTRRGSLPVALAYVGVVDEAVRFLETQPAGTRMIVAPVGCAITFVAGLDNALGMHTFLPLDFDGTYSENRVIRRLEVHPPDLVVYITFDTSEYGKHGFTEDYARDLGRWIMTRYVPVRRWTEHGYSILILRPRSA
jgi:hypothetical protein